MVALDVSGKNWFMVTEVGFQNTTVSKMINTVCQFVKIKSNVELQFVVYIVMTW